jgi:hypothetical protein
MLSMVRLARHMAICLQFFINMKMIILILVFILLLLEADAGSSLGTGALALMHYLLLSLVKCVVVVHLVLRFVVMGLMLVLIFGILVALLVGVLALWSVHRAWLECLVAAVRRGPVLLFLLALVVVVMTTAVVMILPIVVLAIVLVALPAVVTVTSLMMFCRMADLFIIPLAQFVTHLVSDMLLNLMLAFLC